jgi:hypothetical protein
MVRRLVAVRLHGIKALERFRSEVSPALDAGTLGRGFELRRQQQEVDLLLAGLQFQELRYELPQRRRFPPRLGLSQFLSESWELGVVGYVYYQLTNDSYPTEAIIGGLRQQALGGFKSRVASVGPEVGYVFKMGKQTGYFNLRGYCEFWAQNRREGLGTVRHDHPSARQIAQIVGAGHPGELQCHEMFICAFHPSRQSSPPFGRFARSRKPRTSFAARSRAAVRRSSTLP